MEHLELQKHCEGVKSADVCMTRQHAGESVGCKSWGCWFRVRSIGCMSVCIRWMTLHSAPLCSLLVLLVAVPCCMILSSWWLGFACWFSWFDALDFLNMRTMSPRRLPLLFIYFPVIFRNIYWKFTSRTVFKSIYIYWIWVFSKTSFL